MAERRFKGLRYFCDEVYTPGHSAVHKKLQIYVVEIDDQDADEVVVQETIDSEQHNLGEPHISVHALTCLMNYMALAFSLKLI
jgi:hypothetical protein